MNGKTPEPMQPPQPADPLAETRGASLPQRARRGTLVSLGGQGGGQALRLAGNLVLARLLSPDAFGLMAIVNVVLLGLQQISHVGIQPALVRPPRGEEPAFLHTAFTMQAVRGVGLFPACALLAAPIARFYGEPQLVWLLPVASITALFGGVVSTRMVLAQRRLRLERPTAIELGGRILSLIVMVGWAWHSPTVWALVAGGVVAAGTRAIASHLVLPGRRDRFRWDREAASEILGFGQWILLSTLLAFVATRFDVALLGKLLPLGLLGVYSVAIVLPGILRDVATQPIQAVLMPALSESHRQGPEVLARHFTRARAVLLPILVVAIVGGVIGAPAFFETLYDDRYHEAGWMAQLSFAWLWFMLLQDTSGRALLALGDARSWALAAAVKAAATAAGCILGFQLGGLVGVLLGLAVASACGWAAVAWAMASRGLGVLRTDLLYTALTAALVAAGVLGGRLAAQALAIESPALPTLVIGGLILTPYAAWKAVPALKAGRRGTP